MSRMELENQTNEDIQILVVDDEDRIRNLLKMYLEKENYQVFEAKDGQEALDKGLEYNFDLILLDLMLPEIDGLTVAGKIREDKDTPIMILSAKGEESTRIQGFETGADDYIVKPFSPKEVVLRVKAVLRRFNIQKNKKPEESNTVIKLAHIEIDSNARRVSVDGKVINLTPKEFDLLYYLMSSPDQIFGREQLLKEVWKYEFFGDLRTVDTHIKRLREKLKKGSTEASKMIETVWGLGYKLNSYPNE